MTCIQVEVPRVGGGKVGQSTPLSFAHIVSNNWNCFLLSSTCSNDFASSVLECLPFLLLMFSILPVKFRYKLVFPVNGHNKGSGLGA